MPILKFGLYYKVLNQDESELHVPGVSYK